MPVRQQKKDYGPRAIIINAPAIKSENIEGPNFAKEAIYCEDGPRAGQTWQIASVFFKFPEARREAEEGGGPKYEFAVRLFLGTVLAAEQRFVETPAPTGGKGNVIGSMNIVGSLEPYIPAILYSGQGLSLEYEIMRGTLQGQIKSGPGIFTINYTLST